jgi:endonuclease/exonuclease/phosphatase family metal-dependent hydrolase
VAEIAAGYDSQKELVVVAGDFNDEPSSAPLRTLLGTKGLTDVLGKQFPDPKERWTYRDKSQIDYLLVSAPLAKAMTAAGVERRGLFEAAKLTADLAGGPVQAFETVTSDTTDASDHAAVWAEFDL